MASAPQSSPSRALDRAQWVPEARRRPLVAYRALIGDLVELLIAQRLDLVGAFADRQKGGLLMDNDLSDELLSFLRPLARRAPIEDLTEFALPLFVLVLSGVASVVFVYA